MSLVIEEVGSALTPCHEDGTPYPFAIITNENAVFADSITEIIGSFIPDYAEIPLTEEGNIAALILRYDYAASLATTFQAELAAEATENGAFDPAAETEDILTAIMSNRATVLVNIAEWDHVVPLVLLASDYAPSTGRTAPTGNVLWIDPTTETTLIESLAKIQTFDFIVAT